MSTVKQILEAIVVLAVADSLGSGCGTAQKKAMETERLLAAAGFQMHV